MTKEEPAVKLRAKYRILRSDPQINLGAKHKRTLRGHPGPKSSLRTPPRGGGAKRYGGDKRRRGFYKKEWWGKPHPIHERLPVVKGVLKCGNELSI